MDVRTEIGKIIITVNEGYHEIYIDKEPVRKYLNMQTGEYIVEPGPHRVGVLKDGVWLYDEDVIVPGETAQEPEKPADEPEKTISIKVRYIKDLIAEARDFATYLEKIIEDQQSEDK